MNRFDTIKQKMPVNFKEIFDFKVGPEAGHRQHQELVLRGLLLDLPLGHDHEQQGPPLGQLSNSSKRLKEKENIGFQNQF